MTKPIVGPELTTRIANRLERVRLYRDLAEHDVLTGLANQRKSAEVMDRLTHLADRHRQPLSAAMNDVDNFKAVNAEHGHAAGDNAPGWLGKLFPGDFHRDEPMTGVAGGEFFGAK